MVHKEKSNKQKKIKAKAKWEKITGNTIGTTVIVPGIVGQIIDSGYFIHGGLIIIGTLFSVPFCTMNVIKTSYNIAENGDIEVHLQ